ncbi:phage holin family protein [Oscillatoria sp. FACHB-1406]|uniref:phage holin family protein n=1 Tax=Oscillatoria sp. FACHB-1406 TaxID=2692846 RepID=UPI001685B228|nr:phage holin family protein [Oscillatoria sp. FACHB-1406]MBD2577543.1 phage holin family protein [Oscillatoria sp. FACHB-1406]
MLGTLLTLLMTALSLLVVDIIFPGVDLANFPAAMLAAVAIGGVNAFIRPVLSLLSLPINIVTLGAFSLIVNGLCFWLAAVVTPGFHVSGLLAFILGPVILSAVNAVLNQYVVDRYPLLSGTPQAQLDGDRQSKA